MLPQVQELEAQKTTWLLNYRLRISKDFKGRVQKYTIHLSQKLAFCNVLFMIVSVIRQSLGESQKNVD